MNIRTCIEALLEDLALRARGTGLGHDTHAGADELKGVGDSLAIVVCELEPHTVLTAELGKLGLGVVAIAKGQEENFA